MHIILEAYGYDADPFGIDRMDDAELASRARRLTIEIASLERRLERFHDFLCSIDLNELGVTMVDDMVDRMSGNDWRLRVASEELAAVTWEQEIRLAAEAQYADGSYDPDRPDWLDDNWPDD